MPIPLNVGAGHGNGNPYGLGAVTGVFLFPFVFLRLFAPPQYLTAVLMGGVRVYLVFMLVSMLCTDAISACRQPSYS